MKVYFVGAGPGAPDLITIRGARLLASARMVIYAGSLVPRDVLQYCHPEAEIHNSAGLNLDEQVEYYKSAKHRGLDVVRLHSGDPSIYGALAEQIKRLSELHIEYEVVPGVSAFCGAAAALKCELTKPDVSQTVILTRTNGRASKLPDSESIPLLAAHKATMCIFLSGDNLPSTIDELMQHYDKDTPVALVRRATWKDESIHESTLGRLLDEIDCRDWKLTTLLLVGEALSPALLSESKLYSPSYSHLYRRASADAI